MNPIKRIKQSIPKQEFPAILAVINSFVWTIFSFTVLGSIINESTYSEVEKTILFLIFFSTVGITAIIGAKTFPRARTVLLKIWFFSSAVSTFLLVFLSNNNLTLTTLLISLFAASTGVGMPSCLGYFADATKIEKRGFSSGVIWSGVGFSILLLAFLASLLDNAGVIILIGLWRFIGGIGFVSIAKKNQVTIKKESPSFSELFSQDKIKLYLFPWAMFCLLNFALSPILHNYFGENIMTVQIIVWGIAGLVATLGGLVADIVGRRAIIIAGFIMLGVEYAIIVLLSNSLPALYCYAILDGISWGLLCSVFLTTIWGDLGEYQEKEKYYVLGGLTFFLPGFIAELITPYVSDIPKTLAFSLASFFLFLSVLPLLHAPETLPNEKIKEKQLRKYLERAKELKMKGKEKQEPRKVTE